MTPSEIDHLFTYHPPAPGQVQQYADLREIACEMAHLINSACPDSREKSLAISNLQAAVMWANAAIALHGGEPAAPRHAPGCLCPTCGDQMRLKPGWNG